MIDRVFCVVARHCEVQSEFVRHCKVTMCYDILGSQDDVARLMVEHSLWLLGYLVARCSEWSLGCC